MKILFTYIFTFISFATFAQKNTPPPMIYGDISSADLKMNVYEKDSSADAVILGDFGTYSRGIDDYATNVCSRHLRIKVFKKSGFKYIPKQITFYAPKDSQQKQWINNFKATTYFLENETVRTYPLEKKDIFIEKNDDGDNKYSFALPQLREGAIVEISYDLNSDWSDFPTWNFQYEIPVIWSEIRISHPRSLNYDVSLQSHIPLTINENEQKKSNSILIKYRFAMTTIPALKPEPFITTIEDYRCKLDFELAGLNFGKALTRNFSLSWSGLNNLLLTNPYFGLHINDFTKASEFVNAIKKETTDTLIRAKRAYDYIQRTMQWNGEEGISVSEYLNIAFEKHKGGCSEINLILLKLLRDLGIKANPVILSTRNHGKLSDLILKEKFNYVIVQFMYQGKDILLDATNQAAPFGILPLQCLNDRGRLVDNLEGRWVEVKPKLGKREVLMVDMSLHPNEDLKGAITLSLSGYSGIEIRNLFKTKGKKDFTAEYRKTIDNIEIDSLTVFNLDSLEKPFEFKIQTRVKDAYSAVGGLLYFNPMLSMGVDKNPFQTPNRTFPVDFGLTQESIYSATFSIPDDYVIESVPKFQSISLPENGGKFTYGIQVVGNLIRVNSKILLTKTIYAQGEYLPLREFYNRVISKQNEQIVLKKK